MAGTAAVIAAVTTAVAAGGSAIMSNQQQQHAKGASEAENKAMTDQINAQANADKAQQTAKAQQGSVTQTAALQALKAAMATTGSNGGSILTSGSGTTIAPTTTKQLLGA